MLVLIPIGIVVIGFFIIKWTIKKFPDKPESTIQPPQWKKEKGARRGPFVNLGRRH